MSCGHDTVKDEIDNIGIGMSIYFKVIKTMVIVFFVISLINIPLYAVYYLNNSSRKIANQNDILFKGSLGNMASSIKSLFKAFSLHELRYN
jgi:hypothetical protein